MAAVSSSDKRLRAQALEYLDALTLYANVSEIRDLFRVMTKHAMAPRPSLQRCKPRDAVVTRKPDGLAVASDRLFDLRRFVVVDRQIGLRGRQQDNAARLADAHRGAHVLAEEELFHRDRLRPMLENQLAQPAMDDQQPLGQGHADRGNDGAAIYQPQLFIELHQPIAGDRGSRIDAQYPQATPPGFATDLR